MKSSLKTKNKLNNSETEQGRTICSQKTIKYVGIEPINSRVFTIITSFTIRKDVFLVEFNSQVNISYLCVTRRKLGSSSDTETLRANTKVFNCPQVMQCGSATFDSDVVSNATASTVMIQEIDACTPKSTYPPRSVGRRFIVQEYIQHLQLARAAKCKLCSIQETQRGNVSCSMNVQAFSRPTFMGDG